MSAIELPHGLLPPYRPQGMRSPARSSVAAIVGGAVDAEVIDLAPALPREGSGRGE